MSEQNGKRTVVGTGNLQGQGAIAFSAVGTVTVKTTSPPPPPPPPPSRLNKLLDSVAANLIGRTIWAAGEKLAEWIGKALDTLRVRRPASVD